MTNNILLLVGSAAGAFTAIVAAFALIFVTKDRYSKDCSDCRKAIYAEIKALREDLNKKADETAFQAVLSRINELNNNLVELSVTVKMMLRQEK